MRTEHDAAATPSPLGHILDRQNVLFLLLVLVLAAGLRARNINQPFTDAFSWRETSTAMMAENFWGVNPNILYPEVNWSGPGPNYQGREFQTVSYLSALVYQITGQRDWVGRMIAVVFGLVGIVALYGVVRRVWDEAHGLLAALVMAILPGSIAVERSFLPDPAMVALMTLSLWLLLVYLESGCLRHLVLATAVGTLGALTKLPGLLVGVPMLYAVLALLGPSGRLRRSIPLLLSAAVIGTVIVGAYYLWARHLSLTYPPYHFAGDANWVWVDGVGAWLSEEWYLPRMLFVLQWWIWGSVALLLGLIGVLLPAPPRSTTASAPSADARWLIHAWAAGCLVYVLIGSKELIENPWNLHVFSPVAAAFVARAVHWVARPRSGVASRWAWARGTAIVLVLAVSGLHVANRMTSPRHATKSHELGKALRRASQPGDLVVTMAEKLGNPVAIYYSRRRGWIFPPASSDYAWTQIPPDRDSIRMLDELRERGADWFGMTINQYYALWFRHRGLFDHLRQASDFHSKGDDWLVYRLHPVSEGERRRQDRREGTERDGRQAGQDPTAVTRRVTSDH